MMQLMDQYRDVPMSLADASLVTLAEERGVDRVFSLDRDFHIYRLNGRRQFTVIP
jgi:predicted nucleic acid-binding protein